jgi:ABC-type uncharacterized transport system ATPase subunit
VLLETGAQPEQLARLPGVARVERAELPGRFEVFVSEGAKADEILSACFRSGIELRSFDKNDPSLRDVFLKLVSRAEAEEVVA